MSLTTEQEKFKSNNNVQNPLITLYLLGVLVLFALSYFAIFLPYGFHDDYRYLGNQIDRSSFSRLHPDILGGISMGRPVASIAIGLQSLVTTTLESLKWQRAVFFLVVIGFSFSLYRFLYSQLKWHWYWSMTTALIFCSLPQCALLVQWCVLSVFASLSLFTTFLSHRLFRQSMIRFKNKKSSRWLPLTYFFLSVLSLQLSFYNYPVMGVFFCVFTYAYLLFSQEEPRRRVYVYCLKEIIFLSGSMLLFFVSYKVVYQKILFSLFPNLQAVYENLSYHKMELSLNLKSFLMPLVYGALPATTGPFHPVLGNSATLISGFLTIVMLFFCFIGYKKDIAANKNYKKNGLYLLNQRRIIEALLGFSILYPLSLSPVMLSSWQHTFYRTAMGASCLYLLLFMFLLKGIIDRYISLQRIENFYAYILIIFFLANAAFYHLTITNYAFLATREQQYVSQIVADEVDNNSPNSSLSFIVNDNDNLEKNDPISCLFRPSWEFGMTMFHPLRVNIYEFVEYIAKLRGHHGNISVLKKAEEVNRQDQEQIVPTNLPGKMIDLKYIFSLDNNIKSDIPVNDKISTSANVSTEGVNIKLSEENGILTARFPQRGFWETTDNFPPTLEIIFKEEVKLASYSLQRSQFPEGPERMPCSWKVYASKDGIHFTLIDKREKVNDWNSKDFMLFRLNESVSFKKLRFIFDESTVKNIFRMRALKLQYIQRNIIKNMTFSDNPVLTRAIYEDKIITLDFPANLFWETLAPPPRTLDIELNSKIPLISYGLQPSQFTEGPERVPKSWKVYGSMDGKNFSLLDERRNPLWNKTDFVSFNFLNKAEVRFLRFVFGFSKTDIFRIRALRVIFN